MVAALDYSAVIKHHYDIGVLDGREAVRDNKDCASFHQLIHTALDVRVSIEEVASSRIMTGGSETAARAIDIS